MVLLNRPYGGYPSGVIVQLSTVEETALVAQGLASSSVGPVTPGNVSTDRWAGRVGIAAGGTSVTITNPRIDANSKFGVAFSNAASDATAQTLAGITPSAGSVTIRVNAAATAAIALDWFLLPTNQGLLPPN